MTKVLLVGWDSADGDVIRELIAAGDLPCLARIIRAGSSGTLDSYEPYLSPMLWATIATGKNPEQHGIHGFAALDPATGKAVPTSPAARRAKALWTLLSEQGKRCGVVGWLGSHPAEAVHGTYVADSFARSGRGENTAAPPPGSVYPPERADDLAELRLAPADVDPGLLGLFLPRLREIDLKADPRPGKLVEHLAELYTLHNVAVTLAAENQPDFLTVYFHFLDWVSHVFMPFHPPRMAGASERDFELYRHVVTGAYRLQDLLLADLLRHCSAETNLVLVSDHGFASGAHRPAHTPHVAAGIAAWHRPQGIFAASGPAFLPHSRAQNRAQNAALADIAPTILALFGLPRGEDMPGRVLTESLAAAAPLRTIPTWESLAAVAPQLAPPAVPDTGGDALLRQFVQLGYLDASLLDSQTASESGEEARRQNQWNLGVALIAWGKPERALPHLHEAFLAEPEPGQYAYHLARCLLLLGLADEAARAVATLEDRGDDHPRACHLRAELALLAGRFSAVLTLAAVGRRDPSLARDCDRLTRTALIRLRRFREARASLETALASEPRHALLHAGLALINFHQRDTAGAEASARLALELQPQLPLAKRVLEAVARRRGTSRPIRPELAWPELTARALQRRRLRDEFHQREKLWLKSKLQGRHGLAPVASVPRQLETPAPVVSPHDDFHLIVSGAPRSGTSLMMRMLAMAGMPVLTDGVRPPDDHNPHGYFEWEPAKQLPRDPELIAKAAGQAVKVVSPLLRHLPADRCYRVIFMRRDTGEISRSQQTMLGRPLMSGNSAPLTAELELHLRQTLEWSRNAPHIELLEVSFADLIRGDATVFARIAEFVGPGRLKRPEAMPRAVQPGLPPGQQKSPDIRAVAPAAETAVRPPWPDELRRLHKHLPVGPPRVAHPAWHWVIAAGETGRLVGTARLGETRPGQGRLELSVRSAWTKHPAVAELTGKTLAQAVSLGLATVTAQVGSDSPLATHLLGQGFALQSRHEVWNLPVVVALAARLHGVERMLQRKPLDAKSLNEHSLAAARLVCSGLELLEPERIQLQATLGTGVDPRFSFYVGDATQPSGMVLCRRLGTRLYLEVLARNPAAVEPPRATVGALLRAVFLAARDAGIEEVRCAVTPAKAGPVLALMRRGGGSCVSRHGVLVWRGPGAP